MTIKQLRTERGLTQKELAAACGTSQVQIARWEAGQVQPGSASLRKLAEALQCTMDEITPAARKLRASEVFTPAAKDLTAEERRRILKYEQACEYSGWRRYPTTMHALSDRIPDEWWDVYSAQHIGEVMALLQKAYSEGKNAR